MGSFLRDIAGATDEFHAGQPYSPGSLFTNEQQTQDVYQGQSGLANQLIQQSNGMGPNPAQAQYQQNVGQAIQQAAGLQAANRGISPALAANLGNQASTQMLGQAAGNSAVLQAQQQLAAQGQLGTLYNQMGNQQLNQQGVINNANNAANALNAGVAGQNSQVSGQIFGGLMNGAGTVAAAAMAHGGKVPALVSPGEVYLPPDKAQAVAAGKADPLKDGKKIPGQAKVSGDSSKNDTVKAELEAGGIVIPRSVLQSKNPEKEAAKFVAEHLGKNKKHEDDFRQALARAAKERKNK